MQGSADPLGRSRLPYSAFRIRVIFILNFGESIPVAWDKDSWKISQTEKVQVALFSTRSLGAERATAIRHQDSMSKGNVAQVTLSQ